MIVDTAGRDEYRTVTSDDFKMVDGVFIIYDMTNRASFNNVNKYMEESKTTVAKKPIARILIGTKRDTPSTSNVKDTEAQSLANTLGIDY